MYLKINVQTQAYYMVDWTLMSNLKHFFKKLYKKS